MGFDRTGDEQDRGKRRAGGRPVDDGTPQLSADDMTGDSQGLRDLAEKLEGRGLSSRVVTYSGAEPGEEVIEEVIVTNPAARERGQVRVGDDGAVTWEFLGDLGDAGAGRILDEVTNVLRAPGVRFRQAAALGPDFAGTGQQQLIYLNTHWGRSYSFSAPSGPDDPWKAVARFGTQDDLEDLSAADLLAKVRDHYQANKPKGQ